MVDRQRRAIALGQPFGLYDDLFGHGSAYASFQSSQSHTARPITNSRSSPLSQGNSSVNIVTHCSHEHGMRVMSVPQKKRCGPKAS